MAFIPYDSDSGSGFVFGTDSVFSDSALIYTGDSVQFNAIDFIYESSGEINPLLLSTTLDSSIVSVVKDSSDYFFASHDISLFSFIKPFTTTIVAAADSGGPAQVWIG